LTQLSALSGETHYTVDLPGLDALTPLGLALVVTGALVALRGRRTEAVFALVASVPVALGLYALACGPFSAVFGFSADTMGALFGDAYRTLARAKACAGAGFLMGLVAAADALRARPQRSFARAIPGLLVVAFAVGVAGFARHDAALLGGPNEHVMQLFPSGRWIGQAGFEHRAKAFVSPPRYHYSSLFFQGWRDPAPLAPNEKAEARVDDRECDVTVRPTTSGALPVEVRATVRAMRLRRSIPFDVEDPQGHPLWPLRVGARWTFRDRIQWSSEAARRRAIDDEEEARNAAPVRLGSARVTVTVTGVEVREGVRVWRLRMENAGNYMEMRVFGMNGETWLVGNSDDPRIARTALVTAGPASATSPGQRACRIAGMVFNTCGDGTVADTPAGPLAGFAHHAGEDCSIFGTSRTPEEGAAVEGRQVTLCFDSFVAGDGEAMPVASTLPAATMSGAPLPRSEARCDETPTTTERGRRRRR
jgi:hypothetical protein